MRVRVLPTDLVEPAVNVLVDDVVVVILNNALLIRSSTPSSAPAQHSR